jgi:hypothetical protein
VLGFASSWGSAVVRRWCWSCSNLTSRLASYGKPAWRARPRGDRSSPSRELVAEGDTVVGLGTSSWNRNGSGEPAEVKIAHVWTLANGKVTRFQQHVDTAKERYLVA